MSGCASFDVADIELSRRSSPDDSGWMCLVERDQAIARALDRQFVTVDQGGTGIGLNDAAVGLS